MCKLILLTAIFAAAVTMAKPARAQTETQKLEDNINQELLDNELGPNADQDVAPPPEYPYPGAKEEGIETAPKTAGEPTPAPEPPKEVERPVRIDPDTGDYIYDTRPTVPVPVERDEAHTPKAVNSNGDYLYGEKLQKPEFSGREGIEKPTEIKPNGEFKYYVEPSPTSSEFTFHVGVLSPPKLTNTNATPNRSFSDIYSAKLLPILLLDYGMPLTNRVGKLSLQFGSGLFFASGNGVFQTLDPNRRPDDTPLEKYTFVMFPNTVGVQYRFQYSETQPISPYVEGGGGYFTFAELRDDGATPRIGGALTAYAAGGLSFLMDWLDKNAIMELDQEYGINHVFLQLEARQFLGLNKNYDFTGTVFNAGFVLQF